MEHIELETFLKNALRAGVISIPGDFEELTEYLNLIVAPLTALDTGDMDEILNLLDTEGYVIYAGWEDLCGFIQENEIDYILL